MSIQATIAILKTLEVVDSRIKELTFELSEERQNIDNKAERHIALVTKIAGLESAIERMEGTRGELQGELRQLNVQVDKAREKMARCRNEREANAAQRELEEIRRLQRERDIEIQKLVGLIDEASADLGRIEEERSEIAAQIDETEGVAAEKVRQTEAALAEQTKKKEAALVELPQNLRARYRSVVQHRGTGVAAAYEGSCTCCHISLSPMLYQEIMRNELHQCPNCHRILYYSETPPPTSGMSSGSSAEASSSGSDETTDAEGDESQEEG